MSSYDDAPLSRLEPDYLSRYSLQTAPFSSTHDDRFLYLDGERQQLLNMLHHLTRYSQLLLIVVGERGSGKSSIKQRFVSQADDGYLISEVDAHPMMDANELLASIAQGFGLIDMPVSPAQLQNDLYRYLAGLQQEDRVPVLLVDDAHELPQDALEALFYLADAEAGEGNLLRSVLFCEPAIEVMLESSAIQPLKERVTHRMKLPPFDEEQTAEYLKHRLAVAGLEGASPFSPKDIRRIYKASDGIPERINESAHQLLAGGKVEEEFDEFDDQPDEETALRDTWLNSRNLVLGVVGVLILIAVLWWQDEINQQFQPSPQPVVSAQDGEQTTEPPARSVPPASEQVPERVVEFGTDGTNRSVPIDSQESDELVEEPARSPGVDEPPLVTVAPEVRSEPLVAAKTGSETEEETASQTEATTEPAQADAPVLQIEALEPDPVPASDQQQTLILQGSGFDETTRLTVEWGNQRKTLAVSRLTLVDSTRLEFRITVGTRPDTWLVIARNPQTGERDSIRFEVGETAGQKTEQAKKTSSVTTAEADTPQAAASSDLAWLQRQPAEHYTLQLLAARQRDNLRAFIEQHQLDKTSVIFASQRNGEPWYAVAHGSYPSREAAQQAATKLPAGIEPWIRRFGDIQQTLSDSSTDANLRVMTDRPVPRSDAIRDHAAWLWDQDPAHYTLQLIAGRNEVAVQAFIDRHELRGDAVFYQTRRDGRPWYVVVLGDHTTREAALAARQGLPAVLREQSPWPRSFGDIHADLYRN